uniref:LAGLIDADG endonuclease n=1 Tax=Morchella brunnea TaxID=1174671 RepID=A0A8K1I896_9PEZI|nr:LAGLIDADG endonuclease [Morchella brunnea]UBU98514.1 LAGLIDADG endonuclease [Morchella brunnea]
MKVLIILTRLTLLAKTRLIFLYNMIFRYCLKCWVISCPLSSREREGCISPLLRSGGRFLVILFIGYFGQFIVCFDSVPQSSIDASLLTTPVYSNFNLNKKGHKTISIDSRDIISIIMGSLLGSGQVEKIKNGSGTRITFFQEAIHVNYLLWLHNQLATAGYCSTIIPTIGKRLGKKGKLLKTIRFSTFAYTSFDWIHDIWHVKGVKVVPQSIGNYLTPLALAIWIMDSGVKASGGLRLNTNCSSYSDCLLLVQVLYKNFGIKASTHSTGVPSQYTVYIWKEYMTELRDIVSPHIIKEMKYKLLS